MTMNYDFVEKNQEQMDGPVEVVKANPFDLEAARARFQEYEVKIQNMVAQVTALEIKTDADQATAVEMANQARKLAKSLDHNCKDVIKDADEFVKSVRGFVRGFGDKLNSIVSAVRKKVGDYDYQKELKRREEEKRIRDENERRQKELDEHAKKVGVKPVKMPEIKLPKERVPVRTEAGSASTKMEWTHEVIDPGKVPKKYMVVDERAIKQAVKSGVREIAGVKIFEQPKVSFRSA